MSKLIIIENQKTQFIVLRRGLVANGIITDDIFPLENVNSWQSFINCVKIAINQDYDYIDSGEYRRIAKEKLYNIIITEKPSILIIDYLLGGTTCEKGVELAQDIIDKVDNPQFSIIFLSRERSNSDYDNLRVKNNNIYIDWLSKSYSQDENLEANYIKNKLCKEIKEVLEKHSQREDPEVVKELLSFMKKKGKWLKDHEKYEMVVRNYIKTRRMENERKLDKVIHDAIFNDREQDWKNVIDKMDQFVLAFKK